MDQAIRRSLEQWARLFAGEADLLRVRPSMLFQQAANQPDASAPAEAAHRRIASRRETRFWLRYVNKPQELDYRLMTLVGHTAELTACGFTPDAGRIVSASKDRTVRVWDAESGELLQIIDCGVPVIGCAVSPDGNRLATTVEDGTVRLLDLSTGQELARLVSGREEWRGRAFSYQDGTFSPDGSRFICPTEKTITVWDISSGRILRQLSGHTHYVSACGASPDGELLVSASLDRTIRFWSLLTGETVRTVPGDRHFIPALAVTAGGDRVVTGSEKGSLRHWDARTGRALATHRGHGEDAAWIKVPVTSVAASPVGGLFATGSSDATVRLWDEETGALLSVFHGHQEPVAACGFAPDGSRIVSGSWDSLLVWDAEAALERAGRTGGTGGGGMRGGWNRVDPDADERERAREVAKPLEYAWEASTGERYQETYGSRTQVTACAFSPDGSTIAAAVGGSLQLWDGRSGDAAGSCSGVAAPLVYECRFSPDSARVVAALSDGTLKLWDADTGRLRSTLKGHTEAVQRSHFSPDGRRIVSASRSEIRMWAGARWWRRRELKEHRQPIIRFELSPDGSRFVSGCSDQLVRLWNARGKVVAGHTQCRLDGCAFSPDGRLLVALNGTTWDAESGRKEKRFPGMGKRNWVVGDLVKFTPSGDVVVAPAADSVLGVWQVATRSHLRLLEGHNGDLVAVAVSPDGLLVASTATDLTVRIWETESGRQIGQFRTSSASPVSWSPDGGSLLVAAPRGAIRLLKLENREAGSPVVTAWGGAPRWLRWVWPQRLAAGCPLCRRWTKISELALGRMVSCRHCGQELAVARGVIRRGWGRVARAWRRGRSQ